jgi:hypothetical protein
VNFSLSSVIDATLSGDLSSVLTRSTFEFIDSQNAGSGLDIVGVDNSTYDSPKNVITEYLFLTEEADGGTPTFVIVIIVVVSSFVVVLLVVLSVIFIVVNKRQVDKWKFKKMDGVVDVSEEVSLEQVQSKVQAGATAGGIVIV